MERIDLKKNAPELYEKVSQLDELVDLKLKEVGFAEGMIHLLKLRASQINQCAFHIRLHTHHALTIGESMERMSLLNAWRDTQYYTAQERAALVLIESITLIASDKISDKVYFAAHQHLTDDQISAIEWLAIMINTWNRIAITSRYTVKP